MLRMARQNNFESVLDLLDDMVYDRNEVVTYELLSKLGKVHINTGKRLLYHFVFNDKKRAEELHVSYLVAGIQKTVNGDKVHKFVVIPDKNLNAVKKTFTRLTSIHVYSVQKAQLKDDSPLYISHRLESSDDTETEKKFSGVNYKNIQIVQGRTHTVPTVITSTNVPNKVKCEPLPKAKPSGLFTLWQQNESQKKESLQKCKQGSENLELNKSNRDLNNKDQCKEEVHPKKGDKNAKNAVAYLFGKQSEMQKKKCEQPSLKKKDEAVKSQKEPQRRKQQQQETKVEKQKVSVFSSSSEESDDEDDKAPNKKIRRIVSSESESDASSPHEDVGSKEEEQEEESIPPTPPPAGRHKFYRTVTKTYTDDDGFMVTKKVKEYVSEPEDNEEAPCQKTLSPAPKLQQSTACTQPQTGHGPKKQTLLMNFFAKK